MTSSNNIHDRISLAFLQACYQVNDHALAFRVLTSLQTDLLQQQHNYDSLDDERKAYLQNDITGTKDMLQYLAEMEQKSKKSSKG